MGCDMNDERDFDQLLEKRYVPDAPSNLSARIIEASCHLPQERGCPLFSGVLGFVRGFAVRGGAVWGGAVWQPAFVQPARVLATVVVTVLVLGLGVNFGVDFYGEEPLSAESTAVYYSEGDDVELAFYLDDIFDVGY